MRTFSVIAAQDMPSYGAFWDRIGADAIRPHPAYSLGWSRLSCRCCIGAPSQWATIRALYPAAFAAIAEREARSGRTIQRSASVVVLADRGVPYPSTLAQPELARLAGGASWTLPVIERPWRLPAGAFGEAAGPT